MADRFGVIRLSRLASKKARLYKNKVFPNVEQVGAEELNKRGVADNDTAHKGGLTTL